jgi:hypothetical protein
VNYDLMRQALLQIKGADNQVVYWSKPLTWKNQTLTPNPEAPVATPSPERESARAMSS